MSEVEKMDDARARFSLRVWRPIVARALANRRAVAGLIGGGVVIAMIETALPLLVRSIVDEASKGAAAVLAPILSVYAALFLVFNIQDHVLGQRFRRHNNLLAVLRQIMTINVPQLFIVRPDNCRACLVMQLFVCVYCEYRLIHEH